MKWLFILYLICMTFKITRGDWCLNRVTPQYCTCISIKENINSSSLCDKLSNKFNYTIINYDEGIADVQLLDLISCASGAYNINLNVHRNITDPTKCKKNFIDHRLGEPHSEIKYMMHELHDCSICQHKSVPTVTFEYIFSGCYSVEIYSSKLGKSHRYHPVYLKTNYKAEYIKDNIIDIKTNFKQDAQKFEVIIKSTSVLKPLSIYTLLIDPNCQGNCFALNATTQTSYLNNDPYVENFTDSSTYPNASWNCNFTKDILNHTSYVCKVVGLKAGIYLVRYKLKDVYICCNLNPAWVNNTFCDTYFDFNFTEISSIKISYDIPKHDMETIYIILGIVILVVIIVVLALVLCCLYKQRNIKTGSRNDYNMGSVRNDIILPLIQEILIIYARDSEPFMAMVESFKCLLNSVGNTKVYDINTDEQVLYERGQDWIINKISNKNTKVILFLNNCSAEVYQNQKITAYKSPRWQDSMFPYAIAQLKISESRNYTNFFVIYLPSCSNNIAIFEDLNPATRYIMPTSIYMLFIDIFKQRPYFSESLLNNFKVLCQICLEFEKHNSDYKKTILNT